MKNFLFAASLLALAAAAPLAQARTLPLRPAAPVPPTDTVVVRLPNQVVMTLQVRDAQQLRQLPQYHLDSLVARLSTYIQKADAAAQQASTDHVTVQYFPNQDLPGQGLPEEVKITTYKDKLSRRPYGPSNKVEVLLEKKFGMVINTDGKDTNPRRSADTRPERQAYRDSVRINRARGKGSSTEFRLDVGLNALVNKQLRLGDGDVDLRAIGSRYVNLGFDFVQRVGGQDSPVLLSIGPEFAFNNYMLQGNHKWVNVNDVTSVVLESSDRQYQKTKLATTTLNLPLTLNLKLRDRHGKPTLLLGGGGFVGYLLGQHTKLKYFENGDTYKDKDHGSYNLNEFQYGVQGTLGIGDFTLFAKYNMNQLFKDNRGPQTQVLSFGLTLSGI